MHPNKAVLRALLFGLLTVTYATAVAEENQEAIEFADPRLVPVDDDPRLSGSLDGHLRFWGDSFGRPAGQGRSEGLYQQIRLGGSLAWASLDATLSLDLVSGRLLGAGIPTPPPVADHGARPFHFAFDDPSPLLDYRELYLQWQSPLGVLRAGLQTSDWGLGLLANDGVDDDYFFGTTFGGDRVLRALFATAPLRPLGLHPDLDELFVAVGADLVYRDENADWMAGDQAFQFIGSVLWDRAPMTLGAYTAVRRQSDGRDGSRLDVTAFDVYGEREWSSAASNWEIRIGAEAAYLHGKTTRADGARAGDPVDIAALGSAAELDLRHRPARIALRFRGGFATGDANPRAPVMHRFRFDPNYRAGLLLYDHYLPAWTQHSVDGAHDELRLRDAPRGVDNLVESGSVSNSLFLHPQVIWDATEGLSLALGALAAFAHRPVRDLLASFEAGGDAVGVAGAHDPGRTLGWEGQLGARYRQDLLSHLTMEYRAEAALLLPGNVFDDAAGTPGEPTGLLRAFVTASW